MRRPHQADFEQIYFRFMHERLKGLCVSFPPSSCSFTLIHPRNSFFFSFAVTLPFTCCCHTSHLLFAPIPTCVLCLSAHQPHYTAPAPFLLRAVSSSFSCCPPSARFAPSRPSDLHFPAFTQPPSPITLFYRTLCYPNCIFRFNLHRSSASCPPHAASVCSKTCRKHNSRIIFCGHVRKVKDRFSCKSVGIKTIQSFLVKRWTIPPHAACCSIPICKTNTLPFMHFKLG